MNFRLEGRMLWPELPPLLCLFGMHRVAYASFHMDSGREQSDIFFLDKATVLAVIGFIILFLY